MSGRAVAHGAIVSIAVALVFAIPAGANDDAHKIAEKFAGEADGATDGAKKKGAERKATEAKKPATERKAAPDAKKAMVTAEAYYGYGDYAQAADLYRTALTKGGVDKDLANLRLGMSLLGAGDKAGATAAFNAAGGVQAPVAKLWLTYLAQKA